MFARPLPQNVRRARGQVGNIAPLGIPAKGMNARDMFATMGPEYAISLQNVIVEPYGLRTRKGYTEWATNLPGNMPVPTVMSYYPATASPAAFSLPFNAQSNVRRMLVEPRAAALPPAGKLFAATNGRIYDVTAGGPGVWAPEAGVAGVTDYWTWANFQNIAGRFLLVTNDAGGYAYYDGAAWTTPTMGAGAGQIDHVDPALFVFVVEFKKRLWFIEKDSTKAWYLPVSAITGAATVFDFGEQFARGGKLVALANWTVDGGAGIDDYLVAFSSQGDVVIYQGSDPASATDFQLKGVWNVGALPAGHRAVRNTGGDIHVLSHFGVTPLSALLSPGQLGEVEEKRLSYLIAPLVARLMRDYAALPGWSIRIVQKEELLLIKIPMAALEVGGQFLCLKITTGGWSVLRDMPYQDIVNIDGACFAGLSGRVVRAFDGPLDDVKLNTVEGTAIGCQVLPAYSNMGRPGLQKSFKLVRPTFITTTRPTLRLTILTDYGLPKQSVAPTLPTIEQAVWDQALWNVGRWTGLQNPISEWLGCRGVGFVGTVQLDYRVGGDTLLASIEFWNEQGGPM